MKKHVIFLLMLIFLIPKTVFAVEGLVCMYYKQGSAIMYWQTSGAKRGVAYISYKNGEKPDATDPLWHHEVETFLTPEIRADDVFDANGRYLAKCPKYATVDFDFSIAVFDNQKDCAYTAQHENFKCDYELYQEIPKGLDVLLEEKESETTPEVNSPELKCFYKGDDGVVIVQQNTSGKFFVKLGKNGYNYADPTSTCFIELPTDSVAIDVDKYGTNGAILTPQGTLSQCPDRILYSTDEMGIYRIEFGVGMYSKIATGNTITICTDDSSPNGPKLNYNSLCSDNNIKSAVKIIGYIILVIKWIVPLIIIVLGMVDFGKATISNDEKAINKATGALIRRCIAGIAIFFIPTIIMAVLNVIQISKGIEKDTDTTFGACTKCLLDPINSCIVSGGSNTSGGGGGNTGPDNPNGPNIEQTLK